MSEQLITWPEWMGCALVDDYGIQIVDRRISTEMEIGSSRRVEFDTDECIANCSLFLNSLQSSFLGTFERKLLNQGSRWFFMKLYVDGKYETHKVRFRTRPQMGNKTGDYSEYTFNLDIAKREGQMDDGLAEWLLANDPCMDTWPAAYLHYILHVQSPKVTTTPPNIWTATPQDWENAK